MQPEAIPRLPVFGWQALRGGSAAGIPCMLDLPRLHYATSGRAAILLALRALGVGVGDRVLLPTYHCPTMVAPAASLGALPLFYPIDERGFPNLAWLSGQHLRGVRVMLAAHYFGLPQPMGDIRRWCDEHGIALVEDCAHALFGRSGERPIGAWGDIAIGSLTKFMPVPEGGCLVLNTPAVPHPPKLAACSLGQQLQAAVDIAEVGASQRQLTGLNTLVSAGLGALRGLRGRPLMLTNAPTTPPPPAVPTAPPDDPAATVAAPRGDDDGTADFSIDAPLAHRALTAPCRWLSQHLPRTRIVTQRRSNHAMLLRRLSGHLGLRPLLPSLPPDCAPYVFPLWVERPDPGYAELRRLGMPVFRWDRLWPGIATLPGDQGRLWAHHVLQLACHQDLRAADIERFVDVLLALYVEPQRPVSAAHRYIATPSGSLLAQPGDSIRGR